MFILICKYIYIICIYRIYIYIDRQIGRYRYILSLLLLIPIFFSVVFFV